jgi:hypothetical protein
MTAKQSATALEARPLLRCAEPAPLGKTEEDDAAWPERCEHWLAESRLGRCFGAHASKWPVHEVTHNDVFKRFRFYRKIFQKMKIGNYSRAPISNYINCFRVILWRVVSFDKISMI